ncbi:hypothetical protein LY76DRAFT_71089 [Colletotrichum caudatum]|nr:hypothetical protein LY76DRAFT_71089 [Colletotrichum caudatum]
MSSQSISAAIPVMLSYHGNPIQQSAKASRSLRSIRRALGIVHASQSAQTLLTHASPDRQSYPANCVSPDLVGFVLSGKSRPSCLSPFILSVIRRSTNHRASDSNPTYRLDLHVFPKLGLPRFPRLTAILNRDSTLAFQDISQAPRNNPNLHSESCPMILPMLYAASPSFSPIQPRLCPQLPPVGSLHFTHTSSCASTHACTRMHTHAHTHICLHCHPQSKRTADVVLKFALVFWGKRLWPRRGEGMVTDPA